MFDFYLKNLKLCLNGILWQSFFYNFNINMHSHETIFFPASVSNAVFMQFY